MEDFLKCIVQKYETAINKVNVEHHTPFGTLRVIVLGQQALLIRRSVLKSLYLAATTDFDAHLKGEAPLEDIFKKVLREENLIYDEDSKYIWLPDETEYELIYSSPLIEIKSPLPIYLIVSKAIKAPKKNKQLVTDAITAYGDSLLLLLEKYNADFNYFT